MIRLTLRQFRLSLLVAAVGLAIVAIVLGLTGPGLAHTYQTTVSHCVSHGDCDAALLAFQSRDHFLQIVVQALPLLVPVILGMFWGAPLVARELESGTFRLAWTQGRSRRQWLGSKILVVGGTTVVVEGLLSWMTTWWWSSIALAFPNRFSPGLFGIFGIAPIGYAAFAFAFGLCVGTIFRRTLPAMGTTIVGFVAARVAVTFWVRPNFAAPVQRVFPQVLGSSAGFGIDSVVGGPIQFVANPPSLPNALIRQSALVNAAGQTPTGSVLDRICPEMVRVINTSQGAPAKGIGQRAPVPGGMQQAFQECATRIAGSFHQVVVYQPASRYWPFQWAELGVFVVAAAALAAVAYWWIRRRLT